MSTRRDAPRGGVLLCLLPFWSPLTPPLGIAVLKGHLQRKGFNVHLEDFNADPDIWPFFGRYVDILRRSIPEVHRRNLFDCL